MAKRRPSRRAARQVNRAILVLFTTTGHRKHPLSSLNRAVVGMLHDDLNGSIKTAPEDTEIDVWLDSPGGDANAAYKLFLDLRSRCKLLRMVVADYAKSAATLLVFGGDEVYMAPAAELGPLDVQIDHPDRENVTVSGLDVAKALGFVSEFALEYVIAGGAQVFDSTELPRIEVLRRITKFAAHLLEPMVSKLDPHLIHKAVNELDIAKSYGTRMLMMRRLSPDDKAAASARNSPEDLAEHFVKHFPAHDFVISRSEARASGLPVKPLSDYIWASAASDLQRMYRRGETGEHLIGVYSRAQIADLLGEDTDDEQDSDDAIPEAAKVEGDGAESSAS